MDVNEVIRSKQIRIQYAWYETLTKDGLQPIYDLASSFNNGLRCTRGYDELGRFVRMGGYNMCFWVEFDYATKWVVRFPMLGAIPEELVDEKIKTEVATMLFLAEKTTIPIPQLVAYGLTNNRHHPSGLPFLILTHVHGKPLTTMWDGMDNVAKEMIYKQLADIYVQLRSQPFDRIGALTLGTSNRWELSNRPLTRTLASLQRDGIEVRMLPSYKSASDYFIAYFDHHRRRYTEQPNSVYSLLDARQKYAALHLFEELIPRFVAKPYDEGPFVLCHGDLHRANLLVNDDFRIVGVLDWEWSCVLPMQVACLPTFCLSPLKMEKLALGKCDELFEAAEIFLNHLGDQESSMFGERTMSKMLEEMMSNGGYWFGLAVQDIYHFEYLFWEKLFVLSHGIDEEDAIDHVFNSPEHRSAAILIQRKLNEYNKYMNELRALKLQKKLVSFKKMIGLECNDED